MTGQENFLERLIKRLDEQSVPYMLSGSVSSSLHGQPRATNDADIVIAPTKEQLIVFVKSLGDDYYVNPDAALDALEGNSAFNVIDIQNSWKADLIIRKNRPFSREEFQRRQKANVMGLDVWVVSPEDIILSKLEWAKNSKSGQQLQDAFGVVAVQYDHLDKDYLHKWAKELQVESSLEELLKQAKEQLNSGQK
ncbi:MAG: hypothetical protein ACYSW7_11695 [Planctomycetota bacterium]|jgi:hypothetical protein